MRRLLIVPAAGRGSRLHTSTPKPLVAVAGRPMVDHLVDRCRRHVQYVTVVAHPSFADQMRRHLTNICDGGLGCDVVEQPSPTGMLDAILQASARCASCSPRESGRCGAIRLACCQERSSVWRRPSAMARRRWCFQPYNRRIPTSTSSATPMAGSCACSSAANVTNA